MRELTYTLLSEGPSDKVLIPIISWLLKYHLPDTAVQAFWADLWRLDKRLIDSMPKRIAQSVELYRCELLFVHRDADRELRQTRVNEVNIALQLIEPPISIPVICVIPIRETEAWLLFNEQALRRAASNPNGQYPLHIPSLKNIEREPDPKTLLNQILVKACGLKGRRLKSFSASECIYRIAELIPDFAPLRQLSAFAALEADIVQTIQQQGWS